MRRPPPPGGGRHRIGMSAEYISYYRKSSRRNGAEVANGGRAQKIICENETTVESDPRRMTDDGCMLWTRRGGLREGA